MTNICKRPVAPKGQRLTKKPNTPTSAQRERWELIRALGCILFRLGFGGCGGRITIQHIETSMGRRKDHERVIPLCHEHHLGKEGVSYAGGGRRNWEEKYKPEAHLYDRTKELLGEHDV